MRLPVDIHDGAFLYPVKDYLALVRFDSDMPAGSLGMLVGHLAGLARDRINTAYATLSRFNVRRAEVAPWTNLRVRGQHVATIFFYVTPRDQGGLSLPLTAGQVRREILSVFRDNTGRSADVVIQEILGSPPPGTPVAPPHAPANGTAPAPGGGALPSDEVTPGADTALRPLLLVGLIAVGVVYFLGRKERMP